MERQHESRETSDKEQNGQQEDHSHLTMRITHDHESYQQYVNGNANG